MSRVFAGIGRFSVRFRWLVVAIWVIGTIVSIKTLPSLGSVVQNDATSFLPDNSPSVVAAQMASPVVNTRQVIVPVVVATKDGSALSASDLTAITGLEKSFAAVHNVLGVKDAGLSSGGQADLVNLYIPNNRAAQNQSETDGILSDIGTTITQANLPSGLQAHVSGTAADGVANTNSNTSNKIELFTILLIVALLVVVFRSMLAPLLTLLPAVLVVGASGPIVAEAAHHGLQVSVLAQLLLIVLILGAGTDYGLFLIFRMREEMRNGLSPKEAVVRSVERVGESITFSAATVIAALLTLLAATFGIYSNMAEPLAIGVGMMLIAGLTLTPAVLAIFGRVVFWPSKPKPIAAADRRPGMWGRLAGTIVQKPVATLILGLLVFGGMAAASLGYSAAGFGGDTAAPANSDAAAGDALVAQYYPHLSSTPTLIVFQLPQSAWQNPDVLAAAQTALQSDTTEFTHVSGPLAPNDHAITAQQFTQLYQHFGAPGALPANPDPATLGPVPANEYQLYRSTALFISADGKTVIYNVTLAAGDANSTPARLAVPAIRDDAAKAAQTIGATGNGVAGLAGGFYDVSSISNNDLKTVVPIAILIIGILLALVMRSLIAPLYLIASVALSYLAALGAAVIVFTKIGHEDGVSFIVPFFLFLFMMALGEDYNILMMARIREEAHDLPLGRAVVKSVGATGTTITSAGLVLAGTFAVFAVVGAKQGSVQAHDIGWGLTIGILMDTFLVRSLLVPSAVVLLGRWNWWPSRLAERHGELDSETARTEMMPRR
ncbi:MAG TPA: MMPL family transporter [Actinocrinis sp.]|uniref:MMPL family transporter n=1 Tax=Actinocrinis sp. TaxID=1920516 RepID=UPI002DDCA273|nr:MMPL family transporter [Actinocrinis sp.]HEV2348138.1 MMPL family transporter [Actinocrinis sp.]